MSTKKLSDLYLQKEAVIKTTELLESRLERVRNKKQIKTKNLTKNQLFSKPLRTKYKTDSI